MQLKDALGTEYVGPIGVGTRRGSHGELVPEAVLQVVYDTGSADLWLASDLCKKGSCSKKAQRFNHSRSETFNAPKKAVRLTTVYGSGVLEGELGVDSIRIGPLTIQQQPLGLIAEEHGLEDLPLDGIAGLGFPALASSGSVPLVDSLIQQGLLLKPQFAFFLQPDRSLGGFVVWGGSDPRLSEGPLTWYPVMEESYWALDLVAFRVGNRSFLAEAHAAKAPAKARAHANESQFRPLLLVDSGTTFLTAMGDVYDAVVEAAGPRPCSEVGHLPPLVYTIMDVEGHQRDVSMPPEEYMVKATFGTVDSFCIPGIVRIGDFWPGRRSLMILGEVFMRYHLTVFDRGSVAGAPAQVGLARAARGASVQAFLEEGSGH